MKRFKLTLFAIAFSTMAAAGSGGQATDGRPGSIRLTLDAPKAGAKVAAARGSDGLVRFTVRGSAQDVPRNVRLLLWVRPVRPAGDGWYLQRPPLNGIADVDPGSAWAGTAQIGSAQWPPRNGDEVDIAVTAVDRRDAARLFTEEGVVLRRQPIGTTAAAASGIVIAVR